MFTRSSSPQTVVTTLLTVWMTAVSLGVWVRHVHDGAANPHVHGWGWCPGGCPKAQTSHRSESGSVHQHLLICGIECPNEPPADGDTPDAPDESVSAIVSPCERPTPLGLSVLGVTGDLTPLPPATSSDAPAVEPVRHVSRHLPLCAFARRLVSGVLRS